MQATNNTDYLLLASSNVSIFFDNSFVAKTNLRSVSPGESFQTFLGIDPAVKVRSQQYSSTTVQFECLVFGIGHSVVVTRHCTLSNAPIAQ